jgi:hypothetical protein
MSACCATCKHWGINHHGLPENDLRCEAESAGRRAATFPKQPDLVAIRAHREGWRICGFVPHIYDADDTEPKARAVVVDDSGCAGGLFTHMDFYCAHWTPKGEP